MTLSDVRYLGFLAVVVLLFYALPGGRPRRLLLVAASYYFYWKLSFVYSIVLMFVTALTFFGGLALRAPSAQARMTVLFGLLLTDITSPLVVFKYSSFVLLTGAHFVSLFHPVTMPNYSLALPIGISFFTFAAIGYLIDVYLGVIEPETRPLHMILFLAFFPLVTAGPIERGGRLLPQLDLIGAFSARRGLAAVRTIFWGLVLKLIFADTLSHPVNAFFAAPAEAGALESLFGMIHYVFYLYADFAGYSLIAIGSAELLGIEVMPNFRQPFISTTVPEFWRNWHISLSSWVRDYLFSPLQMHWRKYRTQGMAGALIISFVVLGVWHGAGWGFLAFGLMHGVLATFSLYTLNYRNAYWESRGISPKLLYAVRVVITFFVVTMTFVVFRANSMADAGIIYGNIFSARILHEALQGILGIFLDYAIPVKISFVTLWGWILISLLIIGDILVRNKYPLERFPKLIQIAGYNIGTLLLLYIWISGNVAEPFLYYKF